MTSVDGAGWWSILSKRIGPVSMLMLRDTSLLRRSGRLKIRVRA